MPGFLPRLVRRRQVEAADARARDLVSAGVGVRGSGKIELFRADDGRKVEEVPFSNFLANPGLKRIQWMTRHAIGLGYGQETNDFEVGRGATGYPEFWDLASAASGWEGEYADVFSHLILNADDAAEDPGVEYAPKLFTHPVIAWANRDAYAGADTKRGSINFSEVRRDQDRILLVFDWPTSSGNGTFRSLQMGTLDESTLYSYLTDAPGPTTGYSQTFANTKGAVDSGDGTAVWVTDQSNTTAGNPSIRKLSLTDGSLLASITYSNLGSMRPAGIGIDPVSGDLWVEQYNAQGDTIKRVTQAGSVVSSFTLPTGPDGNHMGLAYGDGKLYIAYLPTSTTLRIAQLNTTTGAIIDTSSDLALSTAYAYTDLLGFTYDPVTERLYWVHPGQARVYEFDPDTLDLTNRFEHSSVQYVFRRNGSSLLSYLWHNVASSLGYRQAPSESLGTRTLLGADVTKSALQTMKISYQFDFS